MKTLKTSFFLGLGTIVIMTSCKKEGLEPSRYTLELEIIKKQYAAIVENKIDAMVDSMDVFTKSAADFANLPIAGRFNYARNKFYPAQRAFMASLMYASNSGALSSLTGGFMDRNVSNLNYGFIDYTAGNSGSGIVNNTTINLDYGSLILAEQNGVAEDRVSAIQCLEFLLWGEDLYTASEGQRTHYDYVNTANYERRKTFLHTTSGIFSSLLKNGIDKTSYRAKLNTESGRDFTINFINAISNFYGKFLAEEMIGKAVSTGNEGYELSPFADQTNDLLVHLFNELQYLMQHEDTFEGETEYYLMNLFEDVDAERAEKLKSLINETETLVKGIGMVFDQAILNAAGKDVLNKVKSNCTQISDILQQYIVDLR